MKAHYSLIIGLICLVASCSAAGATFPTGKFQSATGEMHLFDPDGTYDVWEGAALLVEDGIFTISGEEVTFQDDSRVCQGLGAGIYTWSFDGRVISLVAVEDKCSVRRRALTSGLRLVE